MQHAPPVTYPLARSRVAVLLTATLWLAGLLAVGAWLARPGLAPWRQSLSPGLVIVCGLVALRNCLNMQKGQLGWTGQHWFWSLPGGQIEGTVVVCVDLQNQVLARFRTAHGQARWLWLERGWRPERWPELRRALHARARKTRAVTNDGIAQTQ